MSEPEFVAYPKTPRLYRRVVVTEKIDGTNACIIIEEGDPRDWQDGWTGGVGMADGSFLKVGCQSRKRIITPGKSTDNMGFAGWVQSNLGPLAATLGPGRHYGEWFGQGIQRGYGLTEKRFALFNAARWQREAVESEVPGLTVVPVLYEGVFSGIRLSNEVFTLGHYGSRIPGAEGFKAEGVVVFHSQSQQVYKVMCENDNAAKSEQVTAAGALAYEEAAA